MSPASAPAHGLRAFGGALMTPQTVHLNKAERLVMRWHAKSDPFHVEFLEPRRLLSLSVGGDSALSGCAYSVATADFNGDGQSDLATIAYPDAVAVMLANANGTFAAGQPLAAWSGPRSTPAT